MYLLEDFRGEQAAFVGQKDLPSVRVGRMPLGSDKTKARASVSGAVTDVPHVPVHRCTMYADRASVRVDTFAFIKRDH